MRKTCTEPLVWTCAACAHSFKETEWESAGRTCPACGHQPGEWKCSLCQREFQQPFLGKEHPCSQTAFLGSTGQPQPWSGKKPVIIGSIISICILLAVLFAAGLLRRVEQHNESQAISPPGKSASQQPAAISTQESMERKSEEQGHIMIKWSPLRDYRTVSDKEASSNYFFLLWSSSSPNAQDKVGGADYIGLIKDPPFSGRIRKVLQFLDQSRPAGLPDWYPHKLVSIGSIASISGNASEIFDQPKGTLGICKAIGTFANKSKMTYVSDFDGREDGTYQIGLLNPIRLQVDMMDFPASNEQVLTGKIVSFSIPFQ